MRGIMLNVNNQLYAIAGKVKSVEDEGNAYIACLHYEENGHDIQTEVIYRNQTERTDGKECIPYCDLARKMALCPGDTVITMVRFPNRDSRYANGYSVKREGVISTRRGFDVDTTCALISGVVLSLDGYTGLSGNACCRILLWAGKNLNGVPEVLSLSCEDERLVNGMIRNLAPKDGIYARAVFRSKGISREYTKEMQEVSVYRVSDYSVAGYCIARPSPH